MTKRLSKSLAVLLMSVVMVFAAVVPAFASQYDYIENHDVIDCANRYVDGSCYKFLIKIPDTMSTDSVTVNVYNKNHTIQLITSLTILANKEYSSMYLDYSHSGHNYYLLTLDSSVSSFPESMRNGIGIILRCPGYMATNNSNGSFTFGEGYYLYRN